MGSFPETYDDLTWSKRKFIMRKEFNPPKFSLIQQHGRRFIVLHTSVATVTSYENDQVIWIWQGTEALILSHSYYASVIVFEQNKVEVVLCRFQMRCCK